MRELLRAFERLVRLFTQILKALMLQNTKLNKLEDRIMGAVDDLKAEVLNVKAENVALKELVTTETDLVVKVLEGVGKLLAVTPGDNPEVIQAVADLRQIVADSQAERARLAADNPATQDAIDRINAALPPQL